MGYIVHHAIIVTSGEDDIKVHHDKALEVFMPGMVSEILGPSPANGYHSFLIGPDGSKSGWRTSDEGNEAREEYGKYLKASQRFPRWVEVLYGDDGGCLQIIDGEPSDD